MYEDAIEISGDNPGPTSIVLAGVHGNETCGIEAFKRIVSTLKIDAGRIIFAYGNPRAIELGVRFTEANLNRMFKSDSALSSADKQSYEYKRAQELKAYFDQADYLLDIHASNTPESKPFIICEQPALTIAKHLPISLVVNGFDDLEPGGTEYYFNQNGKIGIGIECGYINDPRSTDIAISSINGFLAAVGHINNYNSTTELQSHAQMSDIYFSKTDNFVLDKQFDDFESVAKGQVIGLDGGETISATKDGIILFARNRTKIGDECFLTGFYK